MLIAQRLEANLFQTRNFHLARLGPSLILNSSGPLGMGVIKRPKLKRKLADKRLRNDIPVFNVNELKPFLAEGEVARLLNISKSNLQKRRMKHLPPIAAKVGYLIRYRREEVAKFYDSQLVVGGQNV